MNDSIPVTAAILSPAEAPGAWLIVGVWEEQFPALDGPIRQILLRLHERGDLTGKLGELVPVMTPERIAADRLLFVGLGKRESTDLRARLFTAGSTAARFLTTKHHTGVVLALPEFKNHNRSEDIVLGFGGGFLAGCQSPSLRKKEPSRFAPDRLTILFPHETLTEVEERSTRRLFIEAGAVHLARYLVNLPPCDLYPEVFAQFAQQIANEHAVECTILDEKELKHERMNAILAVGRGSERPSRLAVLRYRRGSGKRLLGLVGKGVTFDSGGLSLKTTEQMVDMKCDMAGAAVVLAAVQAVAELALPIDLLGVIPLVENMPGSKAMKLGDVIQARNGTTIEVLNTDAEGRLILADALAYAVDQNVTHLIDVATLTGACMIALGSEVAGLMSNNDNWADQLAYAAQLAGEKVWQLPMFAHYDEMIRGTVADIRNTGGNRYAGAITAAKFLQRFVGNVPWVHFDIAGPAWAEHESASRDAGGTGFLVRTLIEAAIGFASAHS